MALNYSDVSAGDTILAAHPNALLDDIEQHTHDGTDTTKVPIEDLDVTGGNVPTDGVGTASIEDNAVDADKLAHSIDATGIGFDADKVDGKDKTDFAELAYSGSKVFDSNAPAAWTDLDLSGTIGSNRALVLLKIKGDDAAGTDSYYFRTNGETDTLDLTNTGMNVLLGIAQNEFQHVWLLTDTSGIVEWYSANQRNTEVYVLGYVRLVPA